MWRNRLVLAMIGTAFDPDGGESLELANETIVCSVCVMSAPSLEAVPFPLQPTRAEDGEHPHAPFPGVAGEEPGDPSGVVRRLMVAQHLEGCGSNCSQWGLT